MATIVLLERYRDKGRGDLTLWYQWTNRGTEIEDDFVIPVRYGELEFLGAGVDVHPIATLVSGQNQHAFMLDFRRGIDLLCPRIVAQREFEKVGDDRVACSFQMIRPQYIGAGAIGYFYLAEIDTNVTPTAEVSLYLHFMEIF